MQTFKDWSDKHIQSISSPSLLIAGDADGVLPEHVVELFHLITHCQLAIITGGHVKYPGEKVTLNNGKWTHKIMLLP